MPARLNNRHQKMVREKIQTVQLINRLQYFALKQKGPQGENVILDKDEISAITYLINQGIGTAPKSVTIAGDDDAPLVSEIRLTPVMPPADSDDSE